MVSSNHLNELKKLDNCEQIENGAVPIFIHDKHRFCLPVASYVIHQNHCRPFELVLFDAHTDACEPKQKFYDFLSSNIKNETNTVEICSNYLASSNDDWIIAGMELELISNAHVVGIQIPCQCEPDHYVCKLLDNSGKHQLTYCHTPLDWGRIIKEKLSFESMIGQDLRLISTLRKISPVVNPFWVNIDLDCFIEPGDDQKPWSYEMIRNYLNGNLFNELMNVTSLVTISKSLTSSKYDDLTQHIYKIICANINCRLTNENILC